MSTQFKSGKDGKISVGGTDINVTKWSLRLTEESLETTHSGSGGYKDSIGGIKSAEGSFEADWDALAIPTANPPNLVIGVEPAYIRLYVDATKYYLFTHCRITSMEPSSESKGKVSYSCTFESTGSWTEPA